MPLFILLVALTGWFTCGLAGAFLSLTLPQDVYQEWPITETLEDVQRCVWLGLATLFLVFYLWGCVLCRPLVWLMKMIVVLGQRKLNKEGGK